MIEKFMVHVNRLVMNFNHISCYADDPFYKLLFRIFGKFKNNDVAGFGVFDGNNCCLE